MNLEIFTLCQAATADNGKLNILGAFDILTVNKFPAELPRLFVTLRLRLSKVETGTHKIEINIVDIDGNHIMKPLKADLVHQPPHGQESTTSNLILEIQKLKFKQPGEYSIDFGANGVNISSLPLYIKKEVQNA